MVSPIKLHPPHPRADLVPRPGLVARISEATADAGTALVVAPAGFGKTTLVAEWARGSGRPVGWLSLDEGDDAPARLASGLVAAVENAAPDAAAGARSLVGQRGVSPAAIVGALVDGLAAAHTPVGLVLDDLHRVEARPALDLVGALIEARPTPLGLVLASRSDPPLPLARLRARGALAEVRADALRFALPEAEAALRAVLDDVTPAEAAALAERTEGWPAGIRLAALALRDRAHDERAEFVRRFAGEHRYVADYLTEEVLAALPDARERLLLQASLFDRFSSDLLAAVTDRAAADVQAEVEAADQAGLFLVPLDGEREWYRFHHLFGGLLRHRALRREPAAALYARASAWAAHEGLNEEAIRYALAAGEPGQAAKLTLTAALRWVAAGELGAVERWVGALPPEGRAAVPYVEVCRAWALVLSDRLAEAEAVVEAVEREAAARPDAFAPRSVPELAAELSLVRAHAARCRGDLDGFLGHLEAAKGGLRDPVLQTAAQMNLGVGHVLRGDLPDALPPLRRARAAAAAAGATYVGVTAAGYEAEALLALGRLGEAQALLDAAAPDGGLPVSAGYLTAMRARLAWLRGDDEAAAAALADAGLRAYEAGHLPSAVAAGVLRAAAATDAPARRSAGDALDAVAVRIQGAEAEAWAVQVAAARALLYLQGGRTDLARLWADGYRHRAEEPRRAEAHAGDLAVGRILAAGRDPAADTTLMRAANRAGEVGAETWRTEALAARAGALAVLARPAEAREVLAETLALAAPLGLARPFLDGGTGMGALLLGALEGDGLPNGVSLFAADLASRLCQPSTGGLAEPLSEREVEVLRLVAAGLSNSAIGERLFIAKGTVGKHTHTIYQKIGAGSRVEAVERARQFGLL